MDLASAILAATKCCILAFLKFCHHSALKCMTPSACSSTTALLRLDYVSKSQDRDGYKIMSTTRIVLIPTTSPNAVLSILSR
jgi:hypothetical protein